MKKRYKFGVAGMSVMSLASLVLLSGCGSSGSAGNTADDSNQPVTLRFLYPGTTQAEKDWANQLSQNVKKENPNINIQFMDMDWTAIPNKLSIMVRSKDYPDLTETQDVTDEVAMNTLQPLDDFLSSDSELKSKNFTKSVQDYSVINNKTYSVPLAGIVYGLIVNKKMLADVGMKPSDLKTWADMEKAAKLMTKNGHYGYAIAAGNSRFAFRDAEIVGMSDGLVPSDMTDASKSKYLEMLNFYKDMKQYTPKADVGWSYPDMFQAYSNGEVGMIAVGSYFTANVYSINPAIVKDSVAIPFPKGPSASAPQAMVSNVGVAVVAGSKHTKEAQTVIKAMESDDMIASLDATVNIPASSTVSDSALQAAVQKVYPDAAQPRLDLIKQWESIAGSYGVSMPRIPGQPQIEVAFQPDFDKLLQGSMTPEQAYNDMKPAITNVEQQFSGQ